MKGVDSFTDCYGDSQVPLNKDKFHKLGYGGGDSFFFMIDHENEKSPLSRNATWANSRCVEKVNALTALATSFTVYKYKLYSNTTTSCQLVDPRNPTIAVISSTNITKLSGCVSLEGQEPNQRT